jgi:general secretion pathway protein K
LMKVFHSKRSEQGFVLVTVLVVIALLFPVIMVFYSKTQLNLVQAANFRDSIQAVRTARSGVEGAIGLLRSDDMTYDAKSDRWAMQFPTISVGGGTLEVKIDDEDGKLNINRIVAEKTSAVNADTDRQLRMLIKRLGGKPEIVDALIDWLDADNEVKGDNGAEDDYYKDLGYKPKNGPLDSIGELLLVRGFDEDLLSKKGLKNYITVAPTDGKINANTSPVEVLYGLHEELREGLVDEIVRYREERAFKDLTDLKNAIGITDTLYAKILPSIKVTSSYFAVRSRCTTGSVIKQVEAVLRRDSGSTQAIFWREF